MEGISGITSALSQTTEQSNRGVLSQDEFFSIMITELTNQDPLEPLDNNEFLNQVSQMQTLETMTRLSDGLEALLLGQQVSSAGSLIGKNVSGVNQGGEVVAGNVDSVRVDGDQVTLVIGENLVSIDKVSEVRDSGQPAG